MKLHLLSLITVLVVSTGLNASFVGEVLQAPARAVAGVGRGVGNIGRGLTGRGDYEAGVYAQDRPMERVSAGTYGQGYAPQNLGGELSVDPKTGEYYNWVGDWRSETPRYGNFLTPVE